MSPPNETPPDIAGEARRKAKAIDLSTKLIALALHNDAQFEALSALRKAKGILSKHDLALLVADPTVQADVSFNSADGSPWGPELVERWARRALPYCVEAARLLALAGYPLLGSYLNRLAGAPQEHTCVLAGLQRWSTVNGYPHPLTQDDFGGWFFVSPVVRAAFNHVLAA